MKVGIYLSSQHPPGSDMVAALEEYCLIVRAASDLAWDAVATGQHYLARGTSHLQIVPFLARLAVESGPMTGVAGIMLVGLQNPVEVAETVATLDVIWKGNFVFGVGLGYREVECDAFRVPASGRVRRFEECLEVVKRLWTEEEVTFENEICKLERVTPTCRPVQRPRPPIWVAANSDSAVRRAARVGDTWFINPHASQSTVRRQLEIFRAELASLGKPFPRQLPMLREIFCARDKKSALEIAGPYLASRYEVYQRWGQGKVMPSGDSLEHSFEQLVEGRFVLGSPEECYEQLRPCWEDMGVNFLIFRTHWSGIPVAATLASMRLISDELLPELRKLRSPLPSGLGARAQGAAG